MKCAIYFSIALVISHQLCANMGQPFDTLSDPEKIEAIKISLNHSLPSRASILHWLWYIKEPLYKIEASRILSSYMEDFSRVDYFHCCLASSKNDAHRNVFLKGHYFLDLTAWEMTQILSEYSSIEGRIQALNWLLENSDHMSQMEAKKFCEQLRTLFPEGTRQAVAHRIMLGT